MVRPRIRPSAHKRANVSAAAAMRYGRGGGLRRLRRLGKTRARARRGGCMSTMSSKANPAIHARTSIISGGLAACMFDHRNAASYSRFCITAHGLHHRGIWRRRCCVCRGSGSIGRVYAQYMQRTRAGMRRVARQSMGQSARGLQ